MVALASFLAKDEYVEVSDNMLSRKYLNQYLKRAGLENKAINLVIELGNNLNEEIIDYIMEATQCRNLPYLFS